MSLPTQKVNMLTVQPFMEGFGAEVGGVDFSVVPIPDDVLKTVSARSRAFREKALTH